MNLCYMTMTPCSTNYFATMESTTMPPPPPPTTTKQEESSSTSSSSSEEDEDQKQTKKESNKKKKSSSSSLSNKNPNNKRKRRNRAGSETQFPGKLHDMLEWIHHQNLTHIISWIHGGQAFIIHDPSRLTDILPLFFGQTLYRSFRRQLNMWHFQRMPSGHQNQGAFVHPLFVRGQKPLCAYMSRHIDPNEYVKLLEPEPLPTTSTTSSTSPSNTAILQTPDDDNSQKEQSSHYDIAELFGGAGGRIERNTPSPVMQMVGSGEKTTSLVISSTTKTMIGNNNTATFEDCKVPIYGTEDIATNTANEVSSSDMMPSTKLLFDHIINNSNNNMVGGTTNTFTNSHHQGQLKTEGLGLRPDTAASAWARGEEEDHGLLPGLSTPASPESIEFLFMEGL